MIGSDLESTFRKLIGQCCRYDIYVKGEKQMRKRWSGSLFSAIGLIFLTSCFPTQAYFNQHLQSYKNQPSSVLLDTLGPPSQTIRMSDGKTVWAYNTTATSYVANTSTNQSTGNTSTVVNSITASCAFWFILNSKSVVIKTGNKGNNCATSSDGKKGFGMDVWGGTVLPPAPKSEN